MSPHADVDAISDLLPGDRPSPDHLDVVGHGSMASAFDVTRLLAATSAYAVASFDAYEGRTDPHTVDLDQVAAYCTTHLEIDGEPVPVWADLSGVYPTADGRHIQLHCNFPHHATGVTELLGTTNDRAAVAAAIAERDAIELESALIDAGMIGAAVRTLDEWEGHPHAIATAELPLVEIEQIGDADARPAHGWDDLRVLDCSRVLAGPVAGSLLAGLGADVLRVGAEHLPSVPVGVISTGFGKRNTFIDLRTSTGLATMDAVMRRADVWIDAFRPGSMATRGVTPERAAEISPGIVTVQISAFDQSGPWANRRGFDSIVQTTTGIRWAGGEFAVDSAGRPTESEPRGLPVQALDYATGLLAAGVAAQLLGHQRRVGGSWLARLSLLRTRNWLVAAGGPHPYVPTAPLVDPERLASVDSEFGRVTAVRPFVGEWHHPPMPLGSSLSNWRS